MKVVQSVHNLYLSNEPYYQILKKKVSDIVNKGKNERWHYECRIKTLESFAMKIETGRFDTKTIFEDFFASTIVVKNLTEISSAEEFVKQHFTIHSKRPKSSTFTHKDSFSFPFDDLRLYVSLKDKGIGDLAPDIYSLQFEIQIKTFLQHAWSIATHDLIYKSDVINWAKERVAYQVKATLEHAEISISGVDELSKLSEISKENKEVKRVNTIMKLLSKHWKKEDLPNDKRRLAQNVNCFLDAIEISLTQLEEILNTETQVGRGTNTRDLSPFLIIVQSVINVCPETIVEYLNANNTRRKQKILVTKEMTTPDFENVNKEKLIYV